MCEKMSLFAPCRVHDYTRFHNATLLHFRNHGWMISTGGGILFRSIHLHRNLPTHTIESLSAGIICAVIMLLVLSNRLFNHMLQWDTLKTSGPRQAPEIISCNSFKNDRAGESKYLRNWKLRKESAIVETLSPQDGLQTGRFKERHKYSAGSQRHLCTFYTDGRFALSITIVHLHSWSGLSGGCSSHYGSH